MISTYLLPKSVKREIAAYIENSSQVATEEPKMLYDYYGPFGHIAREPGVIPSIQAHYLHKSTRASRMRAWLGTLIRV